MGRVESRAWLVLVLACAILSGCGPNPNHLDSRLATELLTKALANRQIVADIDASHPMAGDLASPLPEDLPRPPSSVGGGGLDAHDYALLYCGVGAPSEGSANEVNDLLAREGYLIKRYRYDRTCGDYDPVYVFTQAGKTASASWKRSGGDTYIVSLGTGYRISDVRRIRFSAVQGAYYATLDYEATPILNKLGQALATDGDNELGTRAHTATMLLLADGWALAADGLVQ